MAHCMLDSLEALQMFITEAVEHLERIEPELIQLEETPEEPDSEVINSIFRGVHSIKGAAGFVGLKQIGRVSHLMEHLLVEVRESGRMMTGELTDVLLSGVDRLKEMIQNCEQSDSMDVSGVLGRLEALVAGNESGPAPSGTPQVMSAEMPAGLILPAEQRQELIAHGRFLYHLQLPAALLVTEGLTIHAYGESVQAFGNLIDCRVDRETVATDASLAPGSTLDILFGSILEADMVSMALDLPMDQIHPLSLTLSAVPVEDATLKIEEPAATAVEETTPTVSSPAEKPANKAPARPTPPARSEADLRSEETLRVRLDLLNDLMALASEMVLSRNQLMRMSEEMGMDLPAYRNLLQTINRVTSELQEKIMQTRMQPVGVVFQKLPRTVRDLSRALGREVALELNGGTVELDKSIIENLSDPMMHLVRNALDHGLEPPAERRSQGKSEVGNLRISAYHEGGRVIISISDDGRGMDPVKIRNTAIRRGLITHEDAAALNETDLLMLIFAPGFSTAEKVSEVSGRGVGMDVVKRNIEGLGGTITLQSKLGHGSAVLLKLPLTLAIIPSLIVNVEGRKFAIPQVALNELVRLRNDETENRLEEVHGATVLRLRDRLLPVVRLADALNIPTTRGITEDGQPLPERRANLYDVRRREQENPEDRRKSSEGEILRLLVLNAGDNQFGLVVDEIANSEEIVVKPLPRFIKHLSCYAGSTILGDGSVALILDVTGIARMLDLRFPEAESEDRRKLSDRDNFENRELQSLILFENAPGETFAFNLDLVQRVEKIAMNDVETIGAGFYIKHRGRSLRVMKLGELLPVARVEDWVGDVHVIIPKMVNWPFGILARRIIDTVRRDIDMDMESIVGPGILGSTIIDEQIVIFPDLFDIARRAEGERSVRNSPHLKPLRFRRPPRCLLAEDTPFFRRIVANYLEEFGIEVHTAEDGMEAREIIDRSQAPFDLIISDIQMPRMDGLAFARWLRSDSRFKTVPLMALTSLRSDHDRDQGFEAGFDRYELKLHKDELRESLREVLTPLLKEG